MATLYVENVPDDLYEGLKTRAQLHRRSIAAEVVALLEHFVPTAKAQKAREDLLQRMLRMREEKPTGKGPFPSAEEMIREDRER
jgi:plasmid stability protein